MSHLRRHVLCHFAFVSSEPPSAVHLATFLFPLRLNLIATDHSSIWLIIIIMSPLTTFFLPSSLRLLHHSACYAAHTDLSNYSEKRGEKEKDTSLLPRLRASFVLFSLFFLSFILFFLSTSCLYIHTHIHKRTCCPDGRGSCRREQI